MHSDSPPPSWYEQPEEFACYLGCKPCNDGDCDNCKSPSDCHLYE